MDEQEVLDSLKIEDLDKLLSKYFKTLEDIQKEKDLELESQEQLELERQEQLELEKQELENKELTSIEFQTQLITEIKTLQENTSITYHMSFVALVLGGLILIYVLFYKFLKIFI